MMLAVFVLLLASVAAPSDTGSKSMVESGGGLLAASGIDESTAQSMNSRGFDLLKRVVDADKNKNILISPYSIDSAFGLVIPGARGETRKEILDALGLPSNSSEALHALDASLTSAREAKVLTSNSVWIQQGLELFPAYRNEIERFFSGMVRQVDFAKDPDNAANTINKYVFKKTAGMIPEIVNAESFSDADIASVLVNTLYFKCDWAQKFDKTQTQSEEFKCSDGKIIPVEMMNSTFTVPYGENEVSRQIRLGYKDERFSMYVILPKVGKLVQDVLAGLVRCGVADFGVKMERKEIKVSIPKLDVEFERDIKEDLGKAAKGLFRDIVRGKELFVYKVLHKTKLLADEKSTEASAATAVVMMAVKCFRPQPLAFRADRPFAIVLHDSTTGLALFAGVVGAPKETNRPPVRKYAEESGDNAIEELTRPHRPGVFSGDEFIDDDF